jgi:hypothetical protein
VFGIGRVFTVIRPFSRCSTSIPGRTVADEIVAGAALPNVTRG